ncbi:desampylase [Halorubrum vacuolatum]|uniref:desampylase n=1 Tax=Halorubrum vacuolatum TaxID=63740 RepID=UPI000B777466|nr:desampylase [Halorubrum vacuolatum]
MITFERAAYDAVVTHATDGAPAEVCGVLAGTFDTEDSIVEAAHRTENVAEHPRTRYAIDPTELFSTIERVEAEGLSVVGFYHSHPAGGPNPSGTDVERATWDGYSYVICALDGAPFVGSWRWTSEGGRFGREAVALRE